MQTVWTEAQKATNLKEFDVINIKFNLTSGVILGDSSH